MRPSVQQAIEAATTGDAGGQNAERAGQLTELYAKALNDVNTFVGYSEEATGSEHDLFLKKQPIATTHVTQLEYDEEAGRTAIGNFKYTSIRAINTLRLLEHQHQVGLVVEAAAVPAGGRFMSMYKQSKKYKLDEHTAAEQQLRGYTERGETPPGTLRERCNKMRRYADTGRKLRYMLSVWNQLLQQELQDWKLSGALHPVMRCDKKDWEAEPSKLAGLKSFLAAYLICWPITFFEHSRPLLRVCSERRFHPYVYASWRHSAAYARWTELDKLVPIEIDGYALSGGLCGYIHATAFLVQSLTFTEVRKLCADLRYHEALQAAMAHASDHNPINEDGGVVSVNA